MQTSTYVYEPASYRPLARIDGAGLLEPEHPVSVLALAGEDPREFRAANSRLVAGIGSHLLLPPAAQWTA
ncbi:hypothetical protein [Paracidovorax oryzae]|uniref:hypothetical protein n=1 Tax=Paracidovorax oryzae TaxID=862720 RepID=UPI0035D0ED16